MSPPPNIQEALVTEIDAFLSEHKIGETTLGRRAVNDPNVVKRLRQNRITIRTAQRLRDFMAVQRNTVAAE